MNTQGKFISEIEEGKVYQANELNDFLRRSECTYFGLNFDSILNLEITKIASIDKVEVVKIYSGGNRYENYKHIIGHDNYKIYVLKKI